MSDLLWVRVRERDRTIILTINDVIWIWLLHGETTIIVIKLKCVVTAKSLKWSDSINYIDGFLGRQTSLNIEKQHCPLTIG